MTTALMRGTSATRGGTTTAKWTPIRPSLDKSWGLSHHIDCEALAPKCEACNKAREATLCVTSKYHIFYQKERQSQVMYLELHVNSKAIEYDLSSLRIANLSVTSSPEP